MHSLWEPLPSDVADWMGMEAVARRAAPSTTKVRTRGHRGLLARLASFRLRLQH